MHWGGVAGIGVVAAVTAAVATAPDTRRYPLPATVARERLAAAPLPAALLAFAGGKSALVREDDALVWRLGDLDHRSIGRVTLDQDGASTEVTVRFDLADNAIDGSPLSATRMTKSMAESMFAEHVDSVLGGRPFDAQRSMMATALEMQANPQMLKDYGEAIGQQFNQVSAMLNSDLGGDPYFVSERPTGGRAATRPDENSFKPMIDLSE
jgi:hypothetical protein